MKNKLTIFSLFAIIVFSLCFTATLTKKLSESPGDTGEAGDNNSSQSPLSSPENEGIKSGSRKLIQATSPKSEYEGLVDLNMLKAYPVANSTVTEAVNITKPAIVRLKTGRLGASGIIVRIDRDTAIVASNKHQLSASKYSTVTLFNGIKVSGIRSFVSSEYDLGFLEADISKLPYEERIKLRSVFYDKDFSVHPGEEMYNLGSADGVTANIYEGSVADPEYFFPEFGSYMVYSHCKAKPGMSGGGAFDNTGRLIGMITGGIDDDSAALPAAYIFEEFDNYYSNRG